MFENGGDEMTYELTMLRGISACKNELARMQKRCENFALATFSSQCKDGTFGQAVALAEMVLKREALKNYLCALAQVFKQLPKGYKALLTAVYVKRVPHEWLCKKYNVSLSTLYRKLAKARRCFKSKVDALPVGIFPPNVLQLLEKES